MQEARDDTAGMLPTMTDAVVTQSESWFINFVYLLHDELVVMMQ